MKTFLAVAIDLLIDSIAPADTDEEAASDYRSGK
jgi:hypothetical protein